jgi:PAS domain S-box-containing protein
LILACIVDVVTNSEFETFALSSLSSGVHCLHNDDGWKTKYASEVAVSVFGMNSTQWASDPALWIDRIHPSDVDAVKAALDTIKDEERSITYRFRDSNEHYRWVVFHCKRMENGVIVGLLSDATVVRTKEYADRIHLAGRNALATLLDISDLVESINQFIMILGRAMVVDRVRLVRFRKDSKALITHEWVRNDSVKKVELPMLLPVETANWWKNQFEKNELVASSSSMEDLIPFADSSSNVECAVMAVPASIYGIVEGFVSFEVSGVRNWLQMELEEAIQVVNGYSRSVERRIDDRNQIAAEFNVRRSEEKYRQLTSHSPVILFGIDTDGNFTLSEGNGLESMGAGQGDVVGKSVYQVYRNFPDILEQVNAALAGSESHGLTHIGEKCFEVWFTPIWDEERMVVGLSGVAVDITRRNKLEQQQTIMMSELDHRVKNNIAAVMSLVSLSQQGATSIEEFANALNGRLHALAVAHSTLAKSHWSGAWMRDILLLTLQPYMAGSVERIRFEGPDLELPGLLARPMCMVIHELATNAVKYGALSNDKGFVTITSEIRPNSSLRLTWVESNGPIVNENHITGTGTSLLEGLVDHEMHGTITLQFAEVGVVCEMNVPLSAEE